MKNPLMDQEFLTQLTEYPHREVYARIIALSFDELPLETIEGHVTSGSINIDGNSAVRRSCSLSLVAKNININDFYWGLNNKFKLEIGLKNFINPIYPNIIWFKQGIYVISSFSSNVANNSYTISLSGKDKMCLLNGDIGGSLAASVDFGNMEIVKYTYNQKTFTNVLSEYRANTYYVEEINNEGVKEYVLDTDSYNDNTTYYTRDAVIERKSLKLKDIILEAIHTYGREQYSNIIINDLDEAGLELMEYRGDAPIYLLYDEKSKEYTQLILDGTLKVFDILSEEEKTLKECNFNTGINDFNGNRTKFRINKDNDNEELSANQIQYGDVIGYRLTDLTYSGDLISSIGESLTSIIDKIKNMLGPYEYFYDVDGKFIFQAKKIYSNKSWNSLVATDYGVFSKDAIEDSPYSFNFDSANLIQRITHTPSINSIKNDYSIWGKRKGAGDAELLIHARYAIDKKPTKYISISVTDDNEINEMKKEMPDLYPAENIKYKQESKEYTNTEYDWREIIYQMALDYYKYGQWSKFSEKLIDANPEFINGATGYEQYYIDLQGFWRQLYDPSTPTVYTEDGKYVEGKFIETKPFTDSKAYSKSKQKIDNKDIYEVYSDQDTGDKYYLKPTSDTTSSYSTGYYWTESTETCNYFKKPDGNSQNDDPNDYSEDKYYWNKDVVNNPHLLNFWMEFYEGDDSLQQFAINMIGDRQKVVNDSKITSLFFKKVPNIILTHSLLDSFSSDRKSGYTYINITPQQANLFTISGRGKSANEEMTELFNKYSYCSESLSLSLVPIYYLEPNTIININDKVNNIVGKYEVSKITIPLTYNGMMSINATKIIDIV